MTIADGILPTPPTYTWPHGVAARVEMIGPDEAKKLLDANTHNRGVRERGVEMHALAMAAGHWVMNGETIKVATDGRLIDGQHRLLAIERSNATVPIVVVRGIDPKAQESIDNGARRTAADALKLRGHTNVNVLAGAALALHQYRNFGVQRNIAASHQQIVSLLENEPGLVTAVALGARMRRETPRMRAALAGTVVYLMAGSAPESLADYIGRVADGAMLAYSDPRSSLRRVMKNEQSDAARSRVTQFAVLIKAWNAYLGEAQVAMLSHKKGEPFPTVNSTEGHSNFEPAATAKALEAVRDQLDAPRPDAV